MKGPASKRAWWRDPRTWLALVSAALVAWLALKTIEAEPGPGPLSKAHSALEELRGAKGCVACHGSGADGMRAACGTCHTPIERQLAAQVGFHGQLPLAADCARCHTEHHGHNSAPYTPETFVLAGFERRDAFDHRGLDFRLDGAHEGLECAACHPAANAPTGALALESSDGLRFLGLSQACAACHDDPHAGRFGLDCAACHGQQRPFPEAAAFVHTPAFELAGAHAGLGCVTCHPRGSDREIEAYAGRDVSVRGCAECHASPHSAAFLTQGPGGCAACHQAEPRGFEVAMRAPTLAAHIAIGAPLVGFHVELACAACHADSVAYELAHPGRSFAHCSACHSDPHLGQLGDPVTEPAVCARCHTETAPFEQHTFDRAAHAAAGFELDGAHANLACASCHSEAPLGFRSTPSSCAACHTDPHAGRFAQAQDCSSCHSTATFRDARQGFDHARWTGFQLDGAHAALACTVCHPPEVGGRALGAVAAIFLPGESRENLSACTACHSDVHGGAFSLPAHTLSLTQPRGCARCHETADFATVAPERFDHGAWTGFALTGAHAASDCTACHGTSTERRLGRVSERYAGPPNRCETCHADPHQGRFEPHAPLAVETREGCQRCHGDVSFRALVAFEHDWTGYSLAGRHAALACDACHAPSPVRAAGCVLGPTQGRRCADCHADPHGGQFSVDGAVDCARCHGVERLFDDVDFDHAMTRFPLDATHAALECGACHRAAITRDGRVLVRYRPLGTQCADCHGTTGGRGR